MHLYTISEELVMELEKRVQEETNDSFKSQYQVLLQQQRNASASLKSLAEARGGNQAQAQSKSAQSQAQANQQANQQAQQQASQQGGSANSYNQEFATESHVDTSSLTQAQKNATMNQRKETGSLDSDQKGSANK